MKMKTFPIIILLAVSILYGGSMSLIETEDLYISVGQYRSVRFVLQEYQADSARLSGSIKVFPDTSSVELLLFHTDDYMRWSNNSVGVDTLDYLCTSSGEFEVRINGFGSFVLVISNRGNYQPVTVSFDIKVLFAGSGESGDPLPAALRIALFLMMVGVIAIAVGGVITKYVIAHRKRA
ncbi:MAG: hypothetical protein KAW14_05475 [Candidatus Aegiribacteria sp.]|nr:hypothetical protein [Candidatus Aegiribacteria sp.]